MATHPRPSLPSSSQQSHCTAPEPPNCNVRFLRKVLNYRARAGASKVGGRSKITPLVPLQKSISHPNSNVKSALETLDRLPGEKQA